MQVDFPTVVTVGLPAIGVVVWLLRLEGRVNTNEAISARMADDVRYIRERLDQWMGPRR